MSAVVIDEASGPQPAPRRKLRWWHIALPLAVSILFPLGVRGAIRGGIALAHALGYGAASLHVFSGNVAKDSAQLQILMAISYFVMLAVMWWIARSRGAVNLTGYFAPIGARTALLAVGSALLLLAILIAVTYALSSSHLVTFHQTKVELILRAHDAWQLCGALTLAAVLAPIAEEIYFRGLVLAWLRQSWSVTLSAAINAAFFGLAHGYLILDPSVQGWIATAVIACIGLVNVAWTVRTGSLWPAIIAHGTLNGVQVVLASAPVMWGHR